MYKMHIDDEAVERFLADKNCWQDWMDEYTTHWKSQTEVRKRWTILKGLGVTHVSFGCNPGLRFFDNLTGRNLHISKHRRLHEIWERDFPHYNCLDHSIVYKNANTGQRWLLSFVYLDSRQMISESCRKWGIDVQFFKAYDDQDDYHFMYVLYTCPNGISDGLLLQEVAKDYDASFVNHKWEDLPKSRRRY